MGGDGGVVAPHLVQQHLARDRPGAGAIQKLENRRLLFGQADASVAGGLLQQLGRWPEHVGPDGEDRILAVLEDPHLRAQASQQLGDPERLGDIVVGAGIEAAHHVGLVVGAGQHDDRHAPSLLALLGAEIAAIAVGQAHVQDQGVVAGGGFVHAFAGVVDAVRLGDGEFAFQLKLFDQRLAERLVVVHDQYGTCTRH
jgi:hypothetical protein